MSNIGVQINKGKVQKNVFFRFIKNMYFLVLIAYFIFIILISSVSVFTGVTH